MGFHIIYSTCATKKQKKTTDDKFSVNQTIKQNIHSTHFVNCNFSAMIFDQIIWYMHHGIDRARIYHQHTFLSSCIPFTPFKLSLVHFFLLCCCCCRSGCHHPIMARYSFLHKRINAWKVRWNQQKKMHHSVSLCDRISVCCCCCFFIFNAFLAYMCVQRMNARTWACALTLYKYTHTIV